jgi:hypothetical protein
MTKTVDRLRGKPLAAAKFHHFGARTRIGLMSQSSTAFSKTGIYC